MGTYFTWNYYLNPAWLVGVNTFEAYSCSAWYGQGQIQKHNFYHVKITPFKTRHLQARASSWTTRQDQADMYITCPLAFGGRCLVCRLGLAACPQYITLRLGVMGQQGVWPGSVPASSSPICVEQKYIFLFIQTILNKIH